MDNQQPSINSPIYYQKPEKGKGFIYKYTSPSGHCYIGQTVNSLKERAKNILTGSGYQKCSVFWRAIKKYGFQSFKVEILEEPLIEELDERESYYITLFNSCAPNGYNLSNGGERGKECPVFVYSAQNGKFLAKYKSLTEASLQTTVPITTISAILNEESPRKQAHNLTFLKEYVPLYNVFNLARKNYCHIYAYSADGTFYKEYTTSTEACRELNVSKSTLERHLKEKTLCGEHFFVSKDKLNIFSCESTAIPVLQIDIKTGEVLNKFSSCAMAAKEIGLKSEKGIIRVLKRGSGTSGGYFWRIDKGSTTKCLENPTKPVRDSLKKDEEIV